MPGNFFKGKLMAVGIILGPVVLVVLLIVLALDVGPVSSSSPIAPSTHGIETSLERLEVKADDLELTLDIGLELNIFGIQQNLKSLKKEIKAREKDIVKLETKLASLASAVDAQGDKLVTLLELHGD